MSDGLGVPLIREEHGGNMGYDWYEADELEPTHVALSLDPQKRAEYREELARRFFSEGCRSDRIASEHELAELALAVLIGGER